MKFANNSIKVKFLTVLIPITFTMYIGGLFIIYYIFENSFLEKNNSILLKEIDFFDNSLNYHFKLAEQFANLFGSFEFVKQAYNNPNEEQAADELKKEISKVIKKLPGNEKDYQVHFHKLPARSFLRSWTNKRGDDLSSFRQTILQVYKTHKPIKAIELGVGGFAIRGIVPIINDNNNYIGSVEYFFSPNDLLKLISNKDSSSTFITIVKSELANKLFEKDVIQKQYPVEYHNYYFGKPNVDWLNLSELTNKDFSQIMDTTKSISVFNLKYLTVGILPIYDFNKSNIGYYIFFHNNERDYQNLYVKMIYYMIGLILGFTLLIGIFYYFISKMMIKPLVIIKDRILNISEGKL